MSAAATVAVIGAGLSAWQMAEQKKKAAEAAKAGGAFGSVPNAARYQPIDFDKEQLASVMGNFKNLGGINDLVRGTNGMLSRADLDRAKRLIPGYASNMQTQGRNAGQLLNGQLPYDDVMEIVADRGEATNGLGIPGTGTSATLRDLGLSRLDAIKAGGGIMKDMVGMAESISPINRYSKPSDFFVSPTDRIRMAMEQNGVVQQSNQSANNLAGMGNPSAQAALQMSMSGYGETDYAALAQSAAKIVSAGKDAYDNGANPSGITSEGFYTSAANAARANASDSYTPRIEKYGNRKYYANYSIPA